MIIVVCTGGEAPPSPLCLAWIHSCQRIIAADTGLALVKSLGQRAHLWIGDGDSLGGSLDEWQPWFEEARILDRDKDESDTEAAVQAAIAGGAREVWLLGGAGGRMDHWWANLRLVANEPRMTRWLTGHEEAWNLGPGDSLVVESGTVSIFPLGSGPWSVRSEGLQWPLNGLDFTRWHSLSNEAGPLGGRVAVESGKVLVIRPFGIGMPA